MKLLLFSLLLVISSFASTVTFEPTELKSYKDNPSGNTSIYITVVCIDGNKFIVTNSGSSAISTLQVFERTYPSPQPSKCLQDSK